MILGEHRAAIMRVVGAVYARYRAGRHPWLAAFVVRFDNREFGGRDVAERVLCAEWLTPHYPAPFRACRP